MIGSFLGKLGISGTMARDTIRASGGAAFDVSRAVASR
jgi:hypothetical protein